MDDTTGTDTAAQRLRELHAYFREHPVTGRAERSSPSTTPAAPANLTVLDHIQRTVTEVVEHTREANPAAGPAPSRADGVYAWAHQQTRHTDEGVRQRTETLEYRHYLEHALQAGDTAVIRPHRCPACGTLSLHWQAPVQRAVCVNRHCARRNGGVSRSWTLAHLAYEHIAERKSLRAHAT
jgi:hypothetical protein